jgi:hypothetical protein
MKQTFLWGVSSIILATLVSVAYTQIYHKMIVDFSEGISFLQLVSLNAAIGFLAVILTAVFQKIISNKSISLFISNALLFVAAFGFVFGILGMDDVTFKNEDAALFVEYFKGYLMPLVFIPFLAWFSLSPLFSKK